MLVLRNERNQRPTKLAMLASGRIARKYRRAHQRRLRLVEYRKLRNAIPSLDRKQDVTKIDVIQAAVDYIDELHMALAQRFNLFAGRVPPTNCEQLMEAVQNLIVKPHLENQNRAKVISKALCSLPQPYNLQLSHNTPTASVQPSSLCASSLLSSSSSSFCGEGNPRSQLHTRHQYQQHSSHHMQPQMTTASGLFRMQALLLQ